MKAVERNEQVICLYGDCFPDIGDLCRQHGAIKVPGHYCYEMLLGSECFYRFLEDTAGTYFLERDLILNFDEYCLKPLELSDDEMRRYYFQRYRRLIYIRQPADPELSPDAARLAEFLGLSLHVQDADYSYLEGIIKELL